jgi:hypothetical protein
VTSVASLSVIDVQRKSKTGFLFFSFLFLKKKIEKKGWEHYDILIQENAPFVSSQCIKGQMSRA